MDNIDWVALSRLAPEVVIILIFVWFSERQSAGWRGFLREQREATNVALARLAEEIKENTKTQVAQTALLTVHDQRTQVWMAEHK